MPQLRPNPTHPGIEVGVGGGGRVGCGDPGMVTTLTRVPGGHPGIGVGVGVGAGVEVGPGVGGGVQPPESHAPNGGEQSLSHPRPANGQVPQALQPPGAGVGVGVGPPVGVGMGTRHESPKFTVVAGAVQRYARPLLKVVRLHPAGTLRVPRYSCPVVKF